MLGRSRGVLIWRYRLTATGIPITTIKQSHHRLIYKIETPYLVRLLYIETERWTIPHTKPQHIIG